MPSGISRKVTTAEPQSEQNFSFVVHLHDTVSEAEADSYSKTVSELLDSSLLQKALIKFSLIAVMNSSEEKAIVKDMQLASLEVLRKTAHDVFEDKILLSSLSGNVVVNTDGISNGDAIGFPQTNNNGNSCDGYTGLLKVDEQDLVLGRVIGRGAFCVVRDCWHPSFLPTSSKGENLAYGINQSTESSRFSLRNFGKRFKGIRKRKNGSNESTLGASSSSVGSNNNNDSSRHRAMKRSNLNRTRYVLKQLSSELKRLDKINFLKGTVDLAMETRFLALLDHENVVCLKGVAECGAFSDGYFIILEKLNETLGRRVKVWMDMDRQCKGITGVFTGSRKKAQRLQFERISAARSLVAGMDYLHERNIVFRDLVRTLDVFHCLNVAFVQTVWTDKDLFMFSFRLVG